jgi:hypothetical protein
MSGFLHSLLERGVTPVETVRPRVPAIFEPEGLGPGLRWAPPAPLDQEIETESPEPPNPRSAKPAPAKYRTVKNELETDEPPTSSGTDPKPDSRAKAQPTPHRVRAIEPETLQFSGAAEPGQNSVRIERPTPTRASASSAEIASEPDRNRSRRPGTPAVAIPAQTIRTMLEPTRQPQRASRGDQDGRNIASDGGAHFSQETGAATAARRVRESFVDAKPSQASLFAPEPVIHVSIGRIEVRAIAEASPGWRAKEVSPVMGLEEYLKQRSKGTVR